MKFQKNFGKNPSRLDVQKLVLVSFLGCCIIVFTSYISFSQPAGFSQQKVSVPTSLRVNKITELVASYEQTIKPVKETNASFKKPEKKTEELAGEKAEKTPKFTQLNPEPETAVPDKPEYKIIKDVKPQAKPICDFSSHRSEVCEFDGDVRVHGTSNLISLVDSHHVYSSEISEWSVRPYARKRLPNVPKVTLKLLHDLEKAPSCTVNHSKPAVVFSNGGFTGNYYHDYTDILVPLFTTARQFKGEVHFMVNNIQKWWLRKYWPMITGLSNYDIIDYDRDEQVRCFPHIIVGMHFHNDLIINPWSPPFGLSMANFTKFLRTQYSLPKENAVNLREEPEKKPRLLVITRTFTRKFVNPEEIVKMAEDMGFEVVAEDQAFGANVSKVASRINSFDVMMGVHGAGLTNFVFLPTNAVLIQIVPWGNLEKMCKYDFGNPSVGAKLHYLQYSICEEESTLINDYPRDHAVFTDPMSIHNLGWEEMGKIYLEKQNVKLDVKRFRPVLQEALEHLGR